MTLIDQQIMVLTPYLVQGLEMVDPINLLKQMEQQHCRDKIISFAAQSSNDVWDLDAVSMGAFQQALENISFLRAQVGGGMSRLSFAADSLSVQQTNIRAALGRIEDVDIAEESANLSKYSILTQAAASMVAQANSTNDVALMLLR